MESLQLQYTEKKVDVLVEQGWSRFHSRKSCGRLVIPENQLIDRAVNVFC